MISTNMLTMLQHQRKKLKKKQSIIYGVRLREMRQWSIIYGVRLREMCKEIKRNMSKKESVIERRYIESIYFMTVTQRSFLLI